MEIEPLEITREQADWLDSRAGRSVYDVQKDDKGLFTLMTDGYGDVKVYLPV